MAPSALLQDAASGRFPRIAVAHLVVNLCALRSTAQRHRWWIVKGIGPVAAVAATAQNRVNGKGRCRCPLSLLDSSRDSRQHLFLCSGVVAFQRLNVRLLLIANLCDQLRQERAIGRLRCFIQTNRLNDRIVAIVVGNRHRSSDTVLPRRCKCRFHTAACLVAWQKRPTQ